METTLQIIFWASVGLTVWTYFGYPIALRLWSAIFPRPIKREEILPPVTVIITGYNEERRIKDKLENVLAADYPKDKFEVIVVSDGSTDRTDDIVRTFADRGVKLLRIPERHGKHYGQGRGIRIATSDIVILSDATTFFDPDGPRRIVRSFADPTVGCVSSEDRMKSSASGSSGEGAYVRYEMMLRTAENMAGGLIGVSGSFYAVRKHLCAEWIDNMSADFFMPIIARRHGFRTVVDKEAFGYYEVVDNPKKEFQRKVRTIVHGMEVFFRLSNIMNPFHYGLFSIQILHHKLSRWLVPCYLIAACAANIALWGNPFYDTLLMIQAAFYGLALVGLLIPPARQLFLFKIPFFFAMVNYSILLSWYYYLIGKEFVVWEPTKR